MGVVASMGLGPLLHLAVNSRGVILLSHPARLSLWLAFVMGPSDVPLGGFPIETLKRLSTRPPTSIGVVTHGTSSHQAGEVPSLGASRSGASMGVPSMYLALESLITFKQ